MPAWFEESVALALYPRGLPYIPGACGHQFSEKEPGGGQAAFVGAMDCSRLEVDKEDNFVPRLCLFVSFVRIAGRGTHHSLSRERRELSSRWWGGCRTIVILSLLHTSHPVCCFSSKYCRASVQCNAFRISRTLGVRFLCFLRVLCLLLSGGGSLRVLGSDGRPPVLIQSVLSVSAKKIK